MKVSGRNDMGSFRKHINEYIKAKPMDDNNELLTNLGLQFKEAGIELTVV